MTHFVKCASSNPAPRLVPPYLWSSFSLPSQFLLFPFAMISVTVSIVSRLPCPTELLAPLRVLRDFISSLCVLMETEYSGTQLRRGCGFPVYILKPDINCGSGARGIRFSVDFHSYSLYISQKVLFLINFSRIVTWPKRIIKSIVYAWIIINGD